MFAQLFPQIDVSGQCGLDAGHSLFSFAAAPTLLLYSYIPAIVIALLLSYTIYKSDKNKVLSKAFIIFTSTYSLWVINIILQWILVSNKALYVSWQLTAFLEVALYISALNFLFIFCNQKVLTQRIKILFLSLLALIVILSPSLFNVTSYDYENCESELGILWLVIYIFEILVSLVILVYGFLVARQKENFTRRKEIILFSSALAIFLGFFSASNISGELLQIYSFNLFGPIGMLIFIGFVTFLIVRYRSFNVRLFAAQIFVYGLLILIGSELLFVKETVNYIIIGATFIGAMIFGQLLIKSVKKEIEQKEELQKINIQLKDLIQQRESLVHLITHKVKGSFTRTKYVFAEMLNDSFGVLTPEMRKMATTGLESDDNGIKTIDMVLNASNLQNGAVKYEMKKIDLKHIVSQVLSEKSAAAESKGLKIEKEINEDVYSILGDAFWLKEVINNFIDNSIKYTKAGTINIGVKKENNKIIFYVKDTGVGITSEDMKNLFTEGGRGKDSVKVNVDSTGYGLFSVKLIMDAHGGRVWAESKGKDQGSTFFAEFGAI